MEYLASNGHLDTTEAVALEGDKKPAIDNDPETSLGYDSDVDDKDLLLEPPGEECVVKNVYEGPPKCNCCINWVDEYPDDIKKVDIAENWNRALIVRNKKSHSSDKPLEVHEIVIQSPFLKKLLRSAIPNPEFLLENIVLKRPFKDIFHNWTELKEVAYQTTDTKALSHIKLFLNILRRELKEASKQHDELLSNSLMTFSYLWTLFKPGEMIFKVSASSVQMLKLESTDYGTDYSGRPVFNLTCSVVNGDGERFGITESEETIPSFTGLKKITNLPFYPERFIENRAQVRDRLITRGKVFSSLAGTHYRAYRGTAIQTGLFDSSGERSIHVDGRVIIDAKVYYQYNTSKRPYMESLSHDDSRILGDKENEVEDTQKLTQEQLLICVPTVKGYALIQKSWVELNIDNILDITWNQNAFKNLILPSKHKDLILSFVESQLTRQKDTFDDFIEGKGQGVVILLAGSPGIGKTLTAESVAEEMHVPLYSVTAGELGSEIREVEKSLGKILDLAARWNAVLLLDEADVYLASRTTHDIERNRLVSIFLRTLEYYQGILFITTNRAASIDPAFKSRIHISLQYPGLTRDTQKEIWRNFINRSAIKPAQFTEGDFNAFTEQTMNGREIKNAVKLSHLLADRRKEPLMPSHIKSVLGALYDEMEEKH
ncbi:P-loop containing nucleoside triphosphate hydrolase protein [Xylaria cf. heliscus]|nr:P-loop containing nucleoside triphosphate hydrolase protein [Xylaria cf. heliscus]